MILKNYFVHENMFTRIFMKRLAIVKYSEFSVNAAPTLTIMSFRCASFLHAFTKAQHIITEIGENRLKRYTTHLWYTAQ